MSIDRRALLALFICAALTTIAPTAATAGSLLSGYGGPGAGSQAILGSGLINGSGRGGSGGAGGSSGSGAAPVTRSATPSAPAPAASSHGRSGAARGSRRAARRRAGSPVSGVSSGKAADAYPVSSDGRFQTVAAHSDTLGLSGVDLLYILLASGIIIFTGLFTRQLAQRPLEAPSQAGRFDRTPRH
jgi:hypothetical protein